MTEVVGGGFIVLVLFLTAGLIAVAKKLVHKMLHGFKDEIITSLTEISTSVEQVNKAVNHVDEGKPPLTQRVDRIEETQSASKIQLENLANTTEQFIKTTDTKFTSMNDKQDITNAAIENLLESHVETRKKFEEAIKSIPKRKQDYEENENVE